MKKKILSMLLAVVMLVSVMPMSAMTASATINTDKYEVMEIATGFNRDVIAESYPVNSVVQSYYDVNATLLQYTYATKSTIAQFPSSTINQNSQYGFSDDGIIECLSTKYPGLYWQMAPYNQANAMCLRNISGMQNEGVLTFKKIGCYQKMYVLAAGVGVGGGSTTMSVQVTYTDDTTEETSFLIYDHGKVPDIQAGCYDAVYKFNYINNARATVCETVIDTSKLIKSVKISNKTSKSDMGIVVFGVTGEVAEIDAPSTNSATNTTCKSFTANWNSVTNANSYRLDVATDESFSNMVAGYNNKEVNATSCSVTGLTPNQTYYYRVRSVNVAGGQSKSSAVASFNTTNHIWTKATVDAPKTCSVCGATEGSKLPAMEVSYVDPITGETVDLGDLNESTNDEVKDTVNTLVSMPIQKENQIFTGWYTDNGALDKNTTRFDQMTNITAGFTPIKPMAKDPMDEKGVADYMTFELVGVQIREDNTQEIDQVDNIYGGLRYVASFSNELYDSLDIIEYGFVVASKANAEKNAKGNASYKIKNGDLNVKRINCKTGKDHRVFADYRLFTFVIDYEGNEGQKSVEMVARPYIAYRDANGTARIFYGSYRGTNVYGGLSTSYNNCVNL